MLSLLSPRGMSALLILVVAGLVHAGENTVEGVVQKVDAEKREVTVVRGNGKVTVIKVKADASVYRDLRKADFGAIGKGQEITTTYDLDTKESASVALFEMIDRARLDQVYGQGKEQTYPFPGKVVAVDGQKLTIRKYSGRNIVAPLAKGVTVLLDGSKVGLDRIKPGMEVLTCLVLDAHEFGTLAAFVETDPPPADRVILRPKR